MRESHLRERPFSNRCAEERQHPRYVPPDEPEAASSAWIVLHLQAVPD
jgi:hypothetical protein